MSTQTFEYFLPEVSMEVAGCPQPVILHALRSAAIEFCRRSLAWVHQPAAFNTVADQGPYTITLPTGAELVMPTRVFVAGVKLGPAVIDSDDVSAPLADIGSGSTMRYAIDGDKKLVLIPAPASVVEVVLRLAVCPTRTSTGMDGALADEFYVQIASGGIAALTAMANKPWTNPAVSAARSTTFQMGIVAAANKALKGGTNKSVFVKPRAFA